MMKSQIFFWSYVFLAIGNALGHLLAVEPLADYTKVALMPALLAYVYESTRGQVTLLTLLLSAGLIFSWLGDVALLKDENTYFMLGLSAFLLAHIIYAYTFLRSIEFKLRIQLKYLLPIILYGLIALFFLVPRAGSLAGPVVVYTIVICATVILGVHREGLVGATSFRWVAIGILAFAVSDTLLATAKFISPFAGHGVLVMTTYAAAQMMLSQGIIAQEKGD